VTTVAPMLHGGVLQMQNDLVTSRTAASQRTALNALRETNSDIVKVLQAVRALHRGDYNSGNLGTVSKKPSGECLSGHPKPAIYGHFKTGH